MAGEYLDGLVQYVADYDYVSFAEIAQHLEARGMDVCGQQALCLADDPNVILWLGMSAAFVALMRQAVAAKRIYPHPAPPLMYLMDGGFVDMPLAKRMPKGGYKTEHWAPVCFRTVPYKQAKGAR